jgi:hypothetical protein
MEENWGYKLHVFLSNLLAVCCVMRVIKSRRMRLAVLVAHKGREFYRALMGKPEGRRPLGRPRRRWEDNIPADL